MEMMYAKLLRRTPASL